jgi:hypothetical protein
VPRLPEQLSRVERADQVRFSTLAHPARIAPRLQLDDGNSALWTLARSRFHERRPDAEPQRPQWHEVALSQQASGGSLLSAHLLPEQAATAIVITDIERTITRVRITRTGVIGDPRQAAWQQSRQVRYRATLLGKSAPPLIIGSAMIACLFAGAYFQRLLAPAAPQPNGANEIRIILPPPAPEVSRAPARIRAKAAGASTPPKAAPVPIVAAAEAPAIRPAEQANAPQPVSSAVDMTLAAATLRAGQSGEAEAWEQDGKSGYVLVGPELRHDDQTCREHIIWERGGAQGEAVTTVQCGTPSAP